MQIYVEDAVADRIFIDNPFCKPFVDNVITAFNTKLPPSFLIKSETWTSTSRDTSSPLTITNADDETKTESEYNYFAFDHFVQDKLSFSLFNKNLYCL